MKKRSIIFLLLITLLCVSVLSAKTIELKFWTHEDPNRKEIEMRYIQEFQKMYPDVVIKRVEYSSTKIQELILTAFAANEGPDIFNMSIEDEYAYIVNGRVAPVNPKAAGYTSLKAIYAEYMQGMLDPVTFEGNLYGLPLEITNWCIFLNKKVFRDAGLNPEKDYPKTWEDVVALSEKIAIRKGDIVQRRGFDFRYPYYLVEMVPLVEQLGGKLVSDDGKTAIINDEAWIKFLKFMADFGPKGKNLGSPTYQAARKLFNNDNNDIAMCSTGLYQIARIKADNQKFFDSNEWMVIPFPQFKNAVRNVPGKYYGHYYMVNAQKPKETQEMAWKFIGYMLSHAEEYLEKVAIIQPKLSLINSKLFKSYPYSDVFLSDLQKAEVVFYQANSAKIQKHIEEAVQSVMFGNKTPEEALKILKQKAQESLDEGRDM